MCWKKRPGALDHLDVQLGGDRHGDRAREACLHAGGGAQLDHVRIAACQLFQGIDVEDRGHAGFVEIDGRERHIGIRGEIEPLQCLDQLLVELAQRGMAAPQDREILRQFGDGQGTGDLGPDVPEA